MMRVRGWMLALVPSLVFGGSLAHAAGRAGRNNAKPEQPFSSTLRFYKKRAAAFPKDTVYQHHLGLLQIEAGRYTEALHTFQKILSNNPKDLDAVRGVVRTKIAAGAPAAELLADVHALVAEPSFQPTTDDLHFVSVVASRFRGAFATEKQQAQVKAIYDRLVAGEHGPERKAVVDALVDGLRNGHGLRVRTVAVEKDLTRGAHGEHIDVGARESVDTLLPVVREMRRLMQAKDFEGAINHVVPVLNDQREKGIAPSPTAVALYWDAYKQLPTHDDERFLGAAVYTWEQLRDSPYSATALDAAKAYLAKAKALGRDEQVQSAEAAIEKFQQAEKPEQN